MELQMKLVSDKVNSEIFEALQSVQEVETAKVSMFAVNDVYARPPCLRFRFKNIEKGNPIYYKLRGNIKTFRGNLKWDMVTKEATKNYIIIPTLFEMYILDSNFYNEKYYIKELTEEVYKKIIDDAIADISHLADVIRNSG
ncbi:MAG: hypothetical protein ABI723_05075 [Bacteroidia bacterium]